MPAQYNQALAEVCARAHQYNREAASRADRLHTYPAGQCIPEAVAEVLYWDDLYRKEKTVQQYLQEHGQLPAEEPEKRPVGSTYEVPKTGVELGLALRNLSKNVSVWKARLGNDKYPDAAAKYSMYQQLYREAQSAIRQEREARQKQTNDARN